MIGSLYTHTLICCCARPILIHAHVYILNVMYTVVTGYIKAVNTWLASLVWPDQFLHSFLKLCMCKVIINEYYVCTPYKFLAHNRHVRDVHICNN